MRKGGSRLDQLLVEKGLVKSRERAKRLIEGGSVFVEDKEVRKGSFLCSPEAKIDLTGEDIPWVSRAGLKLEKAFDVWSIEADGSVCLDIGASTGGFTEVLLHRGAQKVYALDVSYGQLAEKLQIHPRVYVLDGKNIKNAESSWFTEGFDVVTVDVSFISLGYVIPRMSEFLKRGGSVIILIKPQFEVGKERIGKGVVKDPELHREVTKKIKIRAKEEGLKPVGITESPIKGSKGNKEFLFYAKK
ncbi:MAG: TlyA family RNA methyltransferase [Patescibacteria group bacterium]